MQWDNLKKLDTIDLVKYINEKLIEYKSLQKVATSLGLSNESTIRKYIVNRGYKRVGNEFVLSTYTCNSECNTQNKTNKKDNDDISNTDVIQKPDFKENMLYLSEETETIKNIIEWFKNKDDISNTNIIEIKDGINIELPPGEIKRTTIRINTTVWDLFNEFVKTKKIYDKHDLMGSALLEYIERYKD